MIKILLGGSPCTYWSIAQKNNRETVPNGTGWELFKNYLIVKEKFNPDIFLYENNVSASQMIKNEIKKRLKVWDGSLFMDYTNNRYIEINSALVSAQNRKRFYVHNCGDIEQPKDRGIILRDILENGTRLLSKEKAYCLTARYNGSYQENNLCCEPIRIGDIGSTSQAHRVYSCDGKSVTINAGGGGQGGKTGLYACPCYKLSEEYYKGSEKLIGMITDGEGKYRNGNQPSQQYRVYSCDGKSQVVNTLANENYIVPTNAKLQPVYNVKNGLITIKGKQYPIKLKDGYYIIRKLTVKECCRLQTMPDDYCRSVSNSQAYKGLGNGWTAEVIIHILSHALNKVPKDEKIIVLSMYDGIGTGRYVLDKMGFTNVEYHAYEIDKYAIQIAMSNYPDIIQHGDAYQVRNNEWTLY